MRQKNSFLSIALLPLVATVALTIPGYTVNAQANQAERVPRSVVMLTRSFGPNGEPGPVVQGELFYLGIQDS